MAKISKPASQPAGVKKSKKSGEPKASKSMPEASKEQETAEDIVSHRSEAVSAYTKPCAL